MENLIIKYYKLLIQKSLSFHLESIEQKLSELKSELAISASSCKIERMFSVAGCIAIWQRNRMSLRTISDIMIYRD